VERHLRCYPLRLYSLPLQPTALPSSTALLTSGMLDVACARAGASKQSILGTRRDDAAGNSCVAERAVRAQDVDRFGTQATPLLPPRLLRLHCSDVPLLWAPTRAPGRRNCDQLPGNPINGSCRGLDAGGPLWGGRRRMYGVLLRWRCHRHPAAFALWFGIHGEEIRASPVYAGLRLSAWSAIRGNCTLPRSQDRPQRGKSVATR
jgi:hypothetical protein